MRPEFERRFAAVGPDAPRRFWTRSAARRHCRALALTHYENFAVGSVLLPRPLRPHFFHVYAFCRWADDLADEAPSTEAALARLDWWADELDRMFAGWPRHPVFVALVETCQLFGLERQPFDDLIQAFRVDAQGFAPETVDDLVLYSRYSANPVGRLVLGLMRSATEEACRLSDAACTGLQLANFWQDVSEDRARGRIYLPRVPLRKAGVWEPIQARKLNPAEREALCLVMTQLVAESESLLRTAVPLVGNVRREHAAEIAVILEGGRAILRAIEASGYDVWECRPRVSAAAKARMLAGAALQQTATRLLGLPPAPDWILGPWHAKECPWPPPRLMNRTWRDLPTATPHAEMQPPGPAPT